MRLFRALFTTLSALTQIGGSLAVGTPVADVLRERSLEQRSVVMADAAIIVPAYLYPSSSTSPAAWSPLYTAVQNNPNVYFHIIINPNSGPGSSSPDSDYSLAVTTLKKYSNVILVGYVPTAYATRSTDAIYADIKLYSNWATKGLGMDGIFFDEAVSEISDTLYNYMANITCYARDTITTTANGGLAMVYFNPGTEADIRYYTLADYIVMYEDTYAAYLTTDPEASETTPMRNTAFIVHSMPGTWNQTQLHSFVNGLVDGDQLGSIFVTTNSDQSNPYSSFGADWTDFVAAVANLQTS